MPPVEGQEERRPLPMSATDERRHAIQAAKTDFRTALQRARRVSDAWYRVQALAWVARFAPEAEVERVANEALKAAGAGKDAYVQVASSAWVVRALAERGRTGKAVAAVTRLVSLSTDISHPVSRLNALFLVRQAAWPLESTVRQLALKKSVAACQAATSWQAGRALHNAVLMLFPEDAEDARRVLEQMREGRYQRQALKRLEAGRALTPMGFFW